MSYQIVTDATSDLTPDLLAGLPPLAVVPMPVNIDGEPHSFGPGGDLAADSFYGILRNGSFGSTSMINPVTYMEVFEPILQRGEDLIYLCFSSGLSGTYQGALLCMEELREKYPQRKLCYVDTLSASIGEGQLILGALRQQQAGLSLDALVQWAEAHRLGVCHLFMVDTFEHLRRGGRVSAAVAVAGTALQIKPMLFVDDKGLLEVSEKPRGRKRATQRLLDQFASLYDPQVDGTVFVGHGDCPDEAQALKAAVLALHPKATVHIASVGPVIGSHTGPGILALTFFGKTRDPRNV